VQARGFPLPSYPEEAITCSEPGCPVLAFLAHTEILCHSWLRPRRAGRFASPELGWDGHVAVLGDQRRCDGLERWGSVPLGGRCPSGEMPLIMQCHGVQSLSYREDLIPPFGLCPGHCRRHGGIDGPQWPHSSWAQLSSALGEQSLHRLFPPDLY
jgi:hypothetical protein